MRATAAATIGCTEWSPAMLHEETSCSTPPALYAARHLGGPGFGFSLTPIHRCICGFEVQGAEAMRRHIKDENWLVEAMEDPTLPLITLEEDER